ncbi:MAG: 3D domain-containing protein [Dictyoglomaceae bacterium]|nr:3D domain-containing protein [Dictyoglomaceae bacterium]
MRKKVLFALLTINLLMGNSKGLINEFYFNPSKLIKPPYEITIIDGNKKVMKIKTRANFVWEVIKEGKIKINKKDRITPHPRVSITPFIKTIKIDRVEEKKVKSYVIEKPDIIFKVYFGKNYKERRIQMGREGRIEEEWKLLYINKKLEEKTLLSRRILVEKIPTIYEITSPILKNLKLSSATFRLKKSLTLTATAYHPWEGNGVDDITALGWKAVKGVVAVDPRYIPLRTPLYIPRYGFAIAGDTGGAIKRMRIDLLFPTRREVLNFGRRKIIVYILERIS